MAKQNASASRTANRKAPRRSLASRRSARTIPRTRSPRRPPRKPTRGEGHGQPQRHTGADRNGFPIRHPTRDVIQAQRPERQSQTAAARPRKCRAWGIQGDQRDGQREPHGVAEQQPAEPENREEEDQTAQQARQAERKLRYSEGVYAAPGQERIERQSGRALRRRGAMRIGQPLEPHRLAGGNGLRGRPVNGGRKQDAQED